MKKRLFVVLGGVVLSASVFVLNAHAGGSVGSSRGGKPPKPVPEPISCVLLLAGGATLAALRRWKSKKNSSKEVEENAGNL
ncbi:MAG: PEP-CTERM sorting domain-containing protein [Candidatus Brocadiaceae bacterium]